MSAPKILLTFALFLLGSVAVQAQSFTYSNIRKDYVFDDGFGVPRSKMVDKGGHLQLSAEEVVIDGSVFRRNEKGVYKNAKGKSVDLSFAYEGDKLVAVRLSTGHVINNFMVDAAPDRSMVVTR